MIGARRAWIALMVSSVLIPWRYTLVVDTYEWPSWRWITGRGTPSRGELDSVSMAELMGRQAAPDPGRKRVAAQFRADRSR
jgi:hypothetical protein